MRHFNRPKDSGRSWYLLFWPVFGLRYLLIEQYQPSGGFHEVSCVLDAWIPFWEGFVIPYLMWHICVIGLQLWLFYRDEDTFRRYSRYLMVTMSISTMIFLLWPSCQNLRPASFPRDNALTNLVGLLYRADTNTNVCPSEHVIGAAGFYFAMMDWKKFQFPGKQIAVGMLAFLMATATVFLKQHSVLDLLAALPICAMGYLLAFSGWSFQLKPWGSRCRGIILPKK